MRPNRRDFLTAGVGVVGTAVASADQLEPDVAAELKNRLKYLSPPDGIASDLEARPSPCVEPFATELFVPRVARPLVDLTDYSVWKIVQRWPGEPSRTWKLKQANGKDVEFSGSDKKDLVRLLDSWMARLVRTDVISPGELAHLQWKDKAWLVVFWQEFHRVSERLSDKGVDLGSFPISSAHQRFFDFKPMKFYAYWETEFRWRFADTNRPSASADETTRLTDGADWEKGGWTWGFAQLAEGWDDETEIIVPDGQAVSSTIGELSGSLPDAPPAHFVVWLDESDSHDVLAALHGNGLLSSDAKLYFSGTLHPAELQREVSLPKAYFTYPYAPPEHRSPDIYRVRRWLHSRRIASLDYERVQLNAYFTCLLTKHTLRHVVDHFDRNYFIEWAEHETESTLNPGVYPPLSLAPGQRFAVLPAAGQFQPQSATEFGSELP